MKPPPFRYERADSLSGALEFLARQGDDAKVLAGGQSLVALMNLRLARPAVLLDIDPLEELRFLRSSNGDLEVGALTTQATLEKTENLGGLCPSLAQAIPHVGHAAIRNRGTIGGTIAHADPAAELPVVLVALEGSVTLRSQSDVRTLTAEEFFKGFLATAARPDEIVTTVTFPGPDQGVGVAFEEFARRPGDFALVSVACMVEREAKSVKSARVVLGGVASTPQVVELPESVVGADLEQAAQIASEAASERISPFSDVHGSADYRRHLAGGLVKGAVLRAGGA